MSVGSPVLTDRGDRRLDRLGVIVAVVLGSFLTWFRLPPNAADSLYAEDGALFVQQWAADGSPWLLFEPYAGYQHLIPRMVSGLVVALLPVGAFGVAVTALSCLLVGVTAALVYHLSRDVVPACWARAGLAGIPVLLPLAGLEPIGNLANFHWYAMYLMPWLLLAHPRSTRAAVAWAALAATMAMTEPQTIIFLPLAVLRAWSIPRSRVVISGFLLGLSGQVATYLLTDRPRVPGFPPLLSTIEGYLVNVPLSIFTGDQLDTGEAITVAGWWVAYASFLLFAVAAVIALRLGSNLVRLTVVVLLVSSAASWVASYVVNNYPPGYYSELTEEQLTVLPMFRWGTSAGMLLAAVVPILAGVLVARGRSSARWAPAMVLVLFAVMALTFRNVDNHRGISTPTWSQESDRAAQVCDDRSTAQVDMQASPPGWRFDMPCDLFTG